MRYGAILSRLPLEPELPLNWKSRSCHGAVADQRLEKLKMKIRIHRGTKEIGGTCIEVEAEGRHIALDVGLPLDALEEQSETLLPNVSGFRKPDENLLGVVISHPHQDHFGLVKHIRPEVPVYIGEGAHNILKAASAYVPGDIPSTTHASLLTGPPLT